MTTGQALVFGVNVVDPAGYAGRGLGHLTFCEKDATLVAALTKARGFDTQLFTGSAVTKDAMVNGITAAAETLVDGDTFLLYFSGHGNTTDDISGEEAGRGNMRDETLCLFDNQILDDELYAQWQKFNTGVRIVVLTDACHSGSVLMGAEDDLVRKSPDARESKIMKRLNPTMYSDMRAALPPKTELNCSILHLAGCREDQLSYESKSMEQGIFTGHMLRALEGDFSGSYKQLFEAMHASMPDVQKPVMNHLGVDNETFNNQVALTVG